MAERDGFEPSVWVSTPSASEALPYLANALAGLKLERSDDRRSRLHRPPRRQNRKVLARLVDSGGFARGRFITTDDHIDILIAGAPEAVDALGALSAVLLGTLSWGLSQAMVRTLGRDDGPTTIGVLTLYAAPQLMLASLLFERGQLEALRLRSRQIHARAGLCCLGARAFRPR